MLDNRGFVVVMLLFRGDIVILLGLLGVLGIFEKREWGVFVFMGVAIVGDLVLGETFFGDLVFGVLNRFFIFDGLIVLFFIVCLNKLL